MNSRKIFIGELPETMRSRRLEGLAKATDRTISHEEPPEDAWSGSYEELLDEVSSELEAAKTAAPNPLDRRHGENRAQHRKRLRRSPKAAQSA